MAPFGRVVARGHLEDPPLTKNLAGGALVQAPGLYCRCRWEQGPEGCHCGLHWREARLRMPRGRDYARVQPTVAVLVYSEHEVLVVQLLKGASMSKQSDKRVTNGEPRVLRLQRFLYC